MRDKTKNFDTSIKKFLMKNIPIAKESFTVGDVLSMMEKYSSSYDNADYVYVLNDKKKLVGVFSIEKIFNNSKSTPISNFMHKKLITATLDTKLEKIAHLALQYDLNSIPIVESGELIGIVPSKKIISIVNKALKEHIFYFAGIHKSHLDFENSLKISIFKALKYRSLWLLIGLFGAIIIASYINLFENLLEKYVIVAVFIPTIVYISDALGTQLQTILIRDLAILGNKLPIKKYFFKQLSISFFIALIIAAIMFSVIFLFWRKSYIGFIISLAVFISLMFASFLEFFIPLIMSKFGLDPALGSGPISTIISDITSIVIYFLVISVMI